MFDLINISFLEIIEGNAYTLTIGKSLNHHTLAAAIENDNYHAEAASAVGNVYS